MDRSLGSLLRIGHGSARGVFPGWNRGRSRPEGQAYQAFDASYDLAELAIDPDAVFGETRGS